MTGTNDLLFGLGILALGALATAFMGRWRSISGITAFIFGLFGNFFLMLSAVLRLLGEEVEGPTLHILRGVELGPIFQMDGLGAFFTLLISFISLLALLHSIRYMEIYPKSTALYYPFLLLFNLGMVGVVSVGNMFIFLIFWEFMTLTSYLLVIYESEHPENLLAGFRYFFWSFLAAGCIMIATALLYVQTKSFNFVDFKIAMGGIIRERPAVFHSTMALFLLGFGIKAGMFPLGNFWLPDAHPAAPSPVSALLSGVMIKTGIYGVLRFFLWMLPIGFGMSFWGTIIAFFGAVSLFMGTLSALEQEDVKRMLAYSSIGQIGYILLGIGVGLVLLPQQTPLAYLALIAGMFHILNHGLFKSLLFLISGSLIYRTGTRDLQKLSGLIASMPYTFVAALVAGVAIGGLPPFNGFVSKWLIILTSTLSGKIHYELPIWAVAGIFTTGLTIAYIVKFLGSAFLGLRSNIPKEGDVPSSMQFPQMLLAFLCFLTGFLAYYPLQFIHHCLQVSLGALPSYAQLFGPSPIIAPQVKGLMVGLWNPFLVTASLLFWGLLFYSLLVGAKKEVEVWVGGTMPSTEALIYRARGFSLTLRRGIWSVLPSLKTPSLERMGALSLSLGEDIYDFFIEAGRRALARLRRTHSGLLQTYLLWQILGLAIVLLLAFVLK